MKTTTLLLWMTALVAVSCKKHKDAPPAVKPVDAVMVSYIMNEDNFNLPIWCSSYKGEVYALSQIGTDKKKQEQIVFGYYKDNNGYGFYAPAAYSVVFGQQLWSVQNSTVFKQPKFSPKDFQSMVEKDPNAINVEFINKAFLEADLLGSKVKNFNIGDVFVFQGVDGLPRGIILIKEFISNQQGIKVQLWIQ